MLRLPTLHRVNEIEQRALDALVAELPSATVSRGEGNDAVVRVGDRVILVEAKTVREPRLELVRGALAQTVLRLIKHAEGRELLALVCAPTVSAKVRAEARRFMGAYAADIGWALFDARGNLEIATGQVTVSAYGHAPARAIANSKPPPRPYTDLNRWLLKLLLARDLEWPHEPQQADAKPSMGSIRTLADLRAVGNVSQATVYRFVDALSASHSLTTRPLRVTRWAKVLNDWLASDDNRRAARTSVRGLFGANLAELTNDADILIGGLAALDSYNLLHQTRIGPVELHIRGDLHDLMNRWDLESCSTRDADFRLIQSAHPESVFRAAGFGHEATVDVWQAALDVVGSEARGREQAEHVRDVLLAELRARGAANSINATG